MKKSDSALLEEDAPPPDVANLAYLVYFALGAGILLPWNSFITAVDYFDYLYPNQHIDRIFGVTYLFPCLFVLSVLTVYGQKYSAQLRIKGGLALYLVAIVVVTTMDAIFIHADRRGSVGTFYVTVGALILTGTADALVQGSVIGSAGELPKRYMQAAVSGTAASGVLVSVLRITTKAALPQTTAGLRVSANIYFAVSAAFLVLCLVSYNVVHKLPVINYHRMKKLQRLKLKPTSPETEPLTNEAAEVKIESGEGNFGALKSSSSVIALSHGIEAVAKSKYTNVLIKVKWLAGSITLIYVITLSIFPGFISEDVHSPVLGDWYPVLLITSYNVFDLVGKLLTAVYIPDSTWAMMGGCVGRLLFFPLFASCLHGPTLFRTEAPVFLLTSLLGLTNGYLTSCIMIVTPKTVPVDESETAGILVTISLVLGLTIGSAVSWGWVV